MIRIIFRAYTQPANIEAPEQKAEAQSNQSQTTEVHNAVVTSASSPNTWQRAGLVQDGTMQQSMLNHQLAVEESYEKRKQEAEKAKDERENGSLFGTIFGGPLIGTFIGNAVDTKTEQSDSKREELQNQIEQKEEDIKRLQSELNESEDSSADVNDFAAWLTGYDGGGSEISQNADSNPLKHIAKELTPKYDPDQDWCLI